MFFRTPIGRKKKGSVISTSLLELLLILIPLLILLPLLSFRGKREKWRTRGKLFRRAFGGKVLVMALSHLSCLARPAPRPRRISELPHHLVGLPTPRLSRRRPIRQKFCQRVRLCGKVLFLCVVMYYYHHCFCAFQFL